MPKHRNSIEATKMLRTVKKIYNVFEDPDSGENLDQKTLLTRGYFSSSEPNLPLERLVGSKSYKNGRSGACSWC